MGWVQIRRFQDSDLEGVYKTIMLALDADILAKVYEPGKLETWRDLYSKDYILGISKLRHLYVAEYEGEIVGCAAVHLVDSRAYVSCVYINHNYQGLGIGRALIGALENDEISRKAGVMFLHASLTAKKFYEKSGFHIEGDFPEIIVDSGLESISLVKEV